jgi:ribosomal protein L18E
MSRTNTHFPYFSITRFLSLVKKSRQSRKVFDFATDTIIKINTKLSLSPVPKASVSTKKINRPRINWTKDTRKSKQETQLCIPGKIPEGGKIQKKRTRRKREQHASKSEE